MKMTQEHDPRRDMEEFVKDSAYYDAYVYYTGYIARDRADKTKPALAHYANTAANAAMDMSDKGKVYLLQRKLRPMQYEYIAIKRKPPKAFRNQNT
jgi:hypothetical protein